MSKNDANSPDQSLPYHIRGAFRGFETALSRYLATFNFPLSHFYVLRLQWCENGRTQKNIAEQAFMTESVLSQVIKAMEQSGVLIRKADPKDARIKRVFLTDKGRSLREKIVLKGIGLSRAHAPELSLEEVKTTIDVLIKVTQAFDVYNTKHQKQKPQA